MAGPVRGPYDPPAMALPVTLPMTSLLLVMTYLALSEGSPALVPASRGTWEEADAA